MCFALILPNSYYFRSCILIHIIKACYKINTDSTGADSASYPVKSKSKLEPVAVNSSIAQEDTKFLPLSPVSPVDRDNKDSNEGEKLEVTTV